jgi:hypothetical protein
MSKKLYIDALNYGRHFFAEARFTWALEKPFERVKVFVAALRKAGFEPSVFIDEGIGSAEASEKWISRRMKEVAKGEKNVPQGMSYLLGDMFRSQDVPVFYSLDYDNDDTLAFYAQADDADVLSGDGDFYRYIGRKYTIYSDFEYNKNEIVLLRNTKEREEYIMDTRKDIMREIEDPPPCIDSKLYIPFVQTLTRTMLYRRGVPSPLVRKLNFNPHMVLKPVRRAIYTILFENQGTVITEQFPVWCKEEQTTILNSEYVIPYEPDDKEFLEIKKKLEGDPNLLFEDYFYEEFKDLNALAKKRHINLPEGITFREWHKHCIACKTITYELCCIVNGNTMLSYFIN